MNFDGHDDKTEVEMKSEKFIIFQHHLYFKNLLSKVVLSRLKVVWKVQRVNVKSNWRTRNWWTHCNTWVKAWCLVTASKEDLNQRLPWFYFGQHLY